MFHVNGAGTATTADEGGKRQWTSSIERAVGARAAEASMADKEVSRRDFIKVITTIVGGLVGAALGLPAIAYLLDPAFKAGAKEGWVPVGRVADMQMGVPYPFSFTRVQVNGWERTSNTHGGFALLQSADPNDVLVLNSRCTHLACTVNWKEDAQRMSAPCHDARFTKEGAVINGPPPAPPTATEFHTRHPCWKSSTGELSVEHDLRLARRAHCFNDLIKHSDTPSPKATGTRCLRHCSCSWCRRSPASS
jgi:Rieske Fe-S protein